MEALLAMLWKVVDGQLVSVDEPVKDHFDCVPRAVALVDVLRDTGLQCHGGLYRSSGHMTKLIECKPALYIIQR